MGNRIEMYQGKDTKLIQYKRKKFILQLNQIFHSNIKIKINTCVYI